MLIGARSIRRAALPLAAVAAVATIAGPFAATAQAAVPEYRPIAECLWAGTAYIPGTTVVAGGDEYRCGSRDGGPYWLRGAPTDQAATVPNPGAATTPAGQFSPGARQPGTSYNDYCVGAQLIPGTDDVYQVVRHPNGFLQWRAATPISDWSFGDSSRPEPTWRSPSLCVDGNLT